jgi:hypothetical protein
MFFDRLPSGVLNARPDEVDYGSSLERRCARHDRILLGCDARLQTRCRAQSLFEMTLNFECERRF